MCTRYILRVDWIIVVLTKVVFIEACGPYSHMLISHRARTYFNEKSDDVDYGKLLTYHADAFHAGSVFPDSFYSSLCKGGNLSQISEDTHWTPFLKTAIDYVRNTYPKPWDQATEKLVVFILGIMSHQVSDVLWYSIGIEHGFVKTLAQVDFYGNYSAAREAADIGVDVINQWNYEDYTIIYPTRDWYLPTDDLLMIYKAFYGTEMVDKDTLEECAILPALASVVEGKVSSEFYQAVVNKSPFLLNNVEDYFLGGMSDMVGWTYRSLQNGIDLLENGTSYCELPMNPLFIRCQPKRRYHDDEIKISVEGPKQNNKLTSDPPVEPRKKRTEMQNIETQRLLRGTLFGKKDRRSIDGKGGEQQMPIREMNQNVHANSFKTDPRDGTYTVNSSYARFGWSIATGDLDLDGFQDVVIGAPGYNDLGSVQEGKVFIIYGNDSDSAGFDYSFLDIEVISHINPLYNRTTLIKGYSKKQSRFGSGVAVLDINVDGVLDLAVGAPAYWIDNPLEYKGLISIYLGKGKNIRHYEDVDIAITCQSINCNLGYQLESGDLNGDGNADLVIGLPFFDGKYNQSGLVAGMMASKDISVKKTIAFEDLKWRQKPINEQPLGWFGYNIKVKNQTLLSSSPTVRKCQFPSCNGSSLNIQNIGQLDVFNYGNKSRISNITIVGQYDHDFAGFSADFGFLYDDTSVILAVGFPGRTVSGTNNKYSVDVKCAGIVALYNASDNSYPEIVRFDGSTSNGRFGSFVMVSDINGDDTDDLLIGEPKRNKNSLETKNEEDGTVYVYYGGKLFPKGNPTVYNCTGKIPCPDKSANFTSFTNFGGVNNGCKAKVVNTIAGQVLFTTDIRYPWSETVMWGGFRSGGVHHYYINRYQNALV